jgi:hypothetical protein
MKILLCGALLVLAGCSMTNDEVIQNCELCRKHKGWDCDIFHNGITYSAYRVNCIPKREHK